MRLINQKSEPGAHLKPFVWVRFTHHNSSVVLAYEDASTVVVVRHARAWSWRGKKYTVAMSQEIQTKSFSFPQQWQACAQTHTFITPFSIQEMQFYLHDTVW